MKSIVIPVLLSVAATSHLFGAPPLQSFYDRVKPENPKLYKKVKTGEEWENPFLLVTAQGIIVNGTSKAISPKDIISYLLTLPDDSWPYGRVLALSPIPIRDATSGPIINNYYAETQKILKETEIRVILWPWN